MAVIKLVSQFDNENSRPSLATPTCAGCSCCCCCCCLVTTIAAASISARCFANFVEKQLPNDTVKIKAARKFGFFQPIGFVITILSVLILEISSMTSSNNNVSFFGLLIAAIFYLSFTTAIFIARIELKGIVVRVIGTTLLLCIFITLEFIAGLYLIVNLQWFYVIGAIATCTAIVYSTFKKSNNSIEDQAESTSETKNTNEAESTNEAVPTNGAEPTNEAES